jgi:hypothetical protein
LTARRTGKKLALLGIDKKALTWAIQLVRLKGPTSPGQLGLSQSQVNLNEWEELKKSNLARADGRKSENERGASNHLKNCSPR